MSVAMIGHGHAPDGRRGHRPVHFDSASTMSARRACAYCGTFGKTEKEHVIPRCLYPHSKANSRVQRIRVPSCRRCNAGWADDEAHFRNVLAVAGETNQAVRELWTTTIARSFRELDGLRRLTDLLAQMTQVETEGEPRYMIHPGRDPRVLCVIRKIVRGLAHHHDIGTAIADERVWADVLTFQIPDKLMRELSLRHAEQDIVEYYFEPSSVPPVRSTWFLRFFERTPFVALVWQPGLNEAERLALLATP